MSSTPGLDVHALHALRKPAPDLRQLVDRIRTHLDRHDSFVSYSGGKDSLVILDLAMAADPPTMPVVFFDSGLEFEETLDHLDEVEQHYAIGIERIRAEPPLLELLQETASWDLRDPRTVRPVDLQRALIEAPARLAHARHGPGHLWGVRAAESHGRALTYTRALSAELARSCPPGCCPNPAAQQQRHGGIIRRQDGTTCLGPIWDWTTGDVWAHIARNQLPVNHVYDKLRRLGAPADAQRVTHVLDALKLTEGRITWLARGWPALFNDLATVLPRIRDFT